MASSSPPPQALTLRACGRTLRLEGFPPSFERLARVLLEPATDAEPALVATCEGAWEAPPGCDYWPLVRTDPDPDWPYVAESRLWQCRFHPDRGRFRFRLRPLRTEPTAKRVAHALRLPVLVDTTLRGGRFLHAAALWHRGEAALFVGPSGVGKTTLARKVPAAARLADDTAVLLPDGRRFVAWPSPFPGREGLVAMAAEAPLAAVFVLRQAPREALRRLPPAEAFAALTPHVIPLRPTWTAGNPLEPLASLAERVPAFCLEHTLVTDPLAAMEAALA